MNTYKVRGQFTDYDMEPRDPLQIIRLRSKDLYQLSHLTSSLHSFYELHIPK